MNSESTREDQVDVARLMEEIKEKVRQRRASGFYSDDEVRRITQMELEVTEAVPGFRGELEHLLTALNDTWDTAAEPEITSHRSGIGPVIVGAKRLLSTLTRPYGALLLKRQVEFNARLLHLLNAFVLPVREGLVGVTKRLEELSLAVHERLALLHTEGARRHQDLEREVDTLKAEVHRLRGALERLPPPGPPRALPAPAVPAGAGTLAPEAYLQFEDRHRGSPEEIQARQRGYLEVFAAGPVLDLGCGRGEFLELCREAGLEARGVDADPAMAARCRAAGLDAVEGDLLGHLAGLADGSLRGIFCAHVIEHLPAEAFIALVRLAHDKLLPGGVLVCETPNPACLTVFASAFYVDLTHLRPVHPEGAVFVFEAVGFRQVEVRYLNPCPPESRLQPLEPLWYMRRYETAFLSAINDNLARLNALLWGAQDYAVIGRRP